MKPARPVILIFCLLAAAFPLPSSASDSCTAAADYCVDYNNDSTYTFLPAYSWATGCGPTAAAMVLGYWDNLGNYGSTTNHSKYGQYGKLIEHYIDNSIITSQAAFGGGGNYTLSGYFSSPHPRLLLDLASAFNTTADGASSTAILATGMNSVVAARGYTGAWSTRYSTNSASNDWGWAMIKTEINRGYPFVWAQIGASSGHGVAAWGYNTTNKDVLVYDTWNDVRQDWHYTWYTDDPADLITISEVNTVRAQGGLSTAQDVFFYTSFSGKAWKGNTQETIYWWQYGSDITSVKLYYSTNGGSAWNLIASPASAQSVSTPNSYVWSIPNTINSARARLKVEGYAGAVYTSADGVQENFSITPTPPPNISGLNPNSTAAGGLVVINGADFGTYGTSSAVKFYNNQTPIITSWTDTEIKCIVPAGAASGNVTVTNLGGSDTALFTLGYPQSPHPYPNDSDFNCEYTFPGGPSAIDVTFDAQTYVEANQDWIFVGNLTNIDGSPFTGSTLAGQTKRLVEGGTLKVRLVSGVSTNGWGFKVNNVTEADIAAPGAPTGLAASPGGWTGTNSFTLTWTGPGDTSGIAGAYYKLGSAPASDSDYTAYAAGGSFSAAATAQGGQAIYVWLKDGSGNSDYSKNASVTLYYDATAPGAPTSLAASPAVWTNTNSFAITWTNPSDSAGINGAYYKLGTQPASNSDYDGYAAGGSFSAAAAAQAGQFLYVWLKDNVGNANFQNTAPVMLRWDATAPNNPNQVVETAGLPSGVWQNTVSDPYFSWLGAYDSGGAALQGYSVYWGTDPAGEPGAAYEQTGSYYDPAAFSGTYYLRVRTFDTAGNKTNPITLFTARFDATAPANPTAAAEAGGMASGVWQNAVSDPHFTWSGAADTGGAGVKGYSVYWGAAAAGEPGLSLEQTGALYDPGTFGATYYLRVRTFDNAGNLSDPAPLFTAKYDGAAPAAPVLNETVCGTSWCPQGTPSFSWARPADTGGSGVTAYYGKLDGGGTFTVTSPYAPSLPDGAHTFQLYAVDGAGNQSPLSNLKTVSIDTQLPVSACSALAVFLPAIFTVQWAGSDTGGAQLASFDIQYKSGVSAPWTDWAMNTALTSKSFGPAVDGTYYFRVRARDGAGNTEAWPSASSGDAFTTVDASSPSAPAISSLSNHKQDGTWNTLSNSPQFSFPAADSGSGLAGYSVALDRSAGLVPPMAVGLTGNTTTFTGVADGTWYFYARAGDNAGNWGAAARYGPVKIDLTPPSFTGIVPSKNPAPEGSLAVTVTASEQLSVISATITQNGGTPVPVAMSSQDNLTWTGDYAVATGFDGTASIAVSGRDLPGKSGSGAASFSVDTIGPSQPAVASATHPEDTPTSKSGPVFTWTASSDAGSGLAGYSYAINNSAGYALDAATDTASVSLSTALADGAWWLHLRAADKAGNGSGIARYKFIVDITSPVWQPSFSADPAKAGQLTLVINAGETLAGAPMLAVRQNGQASPTAVATASSDSAVWTGAYTVVPGYDGSASVNMTGLDLAGNIGAGSAGFEVDTVEPTASIALSPPGPLRNGPFSLTLTLADASAITGTPSLAFTPPGQGAVPLALAGADKNWTAQGYIESTLSTGTAVFTLSAADAAGNTGSAITAGGTFGIDTAVSGGTGGTITNSDNTGVIVTPGAYAGSLLLTIGIPDANLPDIADADRNTPRAAPVAGVNLRRDFNAKNSLTGAPITTFSQPLTLTMPYPDADNDGLVDGAGVRESKLKLFRLNPSSRLWEEVSGASSDFAANRFTASVTHFSIYSILTVAPESVVYPVPWKPGSGGNFDSASDLLCGTGLIFDYLPADAAISIYNYQGDLLRELKLTSADNGCKAWDGRNSAGRNVASGIYLAVIKTPAGGRTMKKLAIER